MFYLIEITEYVDGTATAKGVYGYPTKDEAIANFHSKMGGAMKNANYKTELLLVIDNAGAVYACEYYQRPVTE